MEIAAVIAGGILSLSFLIAVYFWNRKSYRKAPHIEETDGHRVEQNDTIKHYEEKRDKLSKLKPIPDAEVVESLVPSILSKLTGAIITFFVGYNIWQEIVPVLNETCGTGMNASTSMTGTDCALLGNAITILPIAALIAIIITVFSIFGKIIGEK